MEIGGLPSFARNSRAKDGAPAICDYFSNLEADPGCPILAKQGWDTAPGSLRAIHFQPQ